jgi:hypothetical protein
MQGPPDLRPLELGELVDRTISFWRAHLKPLFALGVGFQLVIYALSKALSIGLLRTLKTDGGMHDLPMQLALVAGMFGILFLLMWIYWVNGVAISAYAVPALLHQDASPGAAMRRTISRFAATTSSLFGYGLLSVGVVALWFVPAGALLALTGAFTERGLFNSSANALAGSGGASPIIAIALTVLWMFGSFFILIWIWIRLAVAGPVLAAEELGGVSTLTRSWSLVSGRVAPGLMGRVTVRAGVVFAVVMILLVVVNLLLSIPTMVVTAIALALHGATTTPPESMLVPAELVRTVGMGLFAPITWVFAAVFYLDLRVRKEGLDLELQLAPETV